MTRRAVAVLTTALVILSGVACGGTAPGDGQPDLAEGYPPSDLAVLAAELAPVLEAYGVILTRGPLIDRSDGGYDVSPRGTHLALYVQPPEDYTDEQYVVGLRDLSLDTAALVFERWPAIESFDICQEPPQSQDGRPTPAPVTTFDMTRRAWQDLPADVDLAGLLARSLDPLIGVSLSAAATIAAHPSYANAEAEAQLRLGRGELDSPAS